MEGEVSRVRHGSINMKASGYSQTDLDQSNTKLHKFTEWINTSNLEIWALVIIISLESVLLYRQKSRVIEAAACLLLTWLLLHSKRAREERKTMRRKRSEEMREKPEVDFFFQDSMIFKRYTLASVTYTLVHFCFLGYPSPVSLMHFSIATLSLLLHKLAMKMEEVIFLGWILGDCLSYLHTLLPFIEESQVLQLPPVLRPATIGIPHSGTVTGAFGSVTTSRRLDEMVFFLFELFVPFILLGSGLHYYTYFHQRLSLQFALVRMKLARLVGRKKKSGKRSKSVGEEPEKLETLPNMEMPASGYQHAPISSGQDSAAEEEALAAQEEEKIKSYYSSKLEAKDLINGLLIILCLVHVMVGAWFFKMHFEEIQELVTAAIPWGLFGVVFVIIISVVAYLARLYKWFPITITRKLFHLLAIIIFVPGMEHHPKLLCILFAWAVALFVMVEVLRVAFKVYHIYPTLVQASEQFLKGFNDGKDEKFILTHTYLLLGCIYPMLSTIIRERTWNLMSGGAQPHYQFDKLKGMFSVSGLAVVGVADAFASVIGKSLGRHRIGHLKKSVEGTVAFVISASAFLLLIGKSQSIFWETVCFIFMAVIELFSGLVDNLVLPTLCLATLRLFAALTLL